MSVRKLKIIALNVNSIVTSNRRVKLQYFIQSHELDIMILNETKLNVKHKVRFPSYCTYRNDRLTDGGGGTAILVKNNIKHEILNTPSIRSAEASIVKLPLKGSSVSIVSFYNPKKLLNEDMNTILKMDSNIFVGGDFNAKHVSWHNSNNNSNGNSLNNFLLNNNNIQIHYPNEFTCRRSANNPSTIDIAISKNVNVSKPRVLLYDSDHDAVEYILNLSNELNYESPIEHFMYKEADWSKFKTAIHESLPDVDVQLNSKDDIDMNLKLLSEVILIAMNESIPKKRFSGCNDFPTEIKLLIDYKNKLRRKNHRKHGKLKPLINRLNILIDEKINNYRSNMLNGKLKNIRLDGKMYDNIGKLLNNTFQKPPLISDDGRIISNPTDQANIFAHSFHEIHMQNRELGNPIFSDHVRDTVNSLANENQQSQDLRLTDAEEVRLILKSLKNKKSKGPDMIPNLVIKKLPSKCFELLANICNACLKTRYYPQEWKLAHVLPVLKPNKEANDPMNYRPISLLCNLSKVLEKIIYKRIFDFCKDNSIIPDSQYGFKPKHSTVHVLLKLIEDVSAGFNDDKLTIAVLLDIAKAFDTVWIDGLLYKLIQLNFPNYIVQLMTSYLKERKFTVLVGNTTSDINDIGEGIPQGSVLGPLLFLIYVSDMPLVTGVSLSLFADDTNTYHTSNCTYTSCVKIQEQLDVLEKYYTKWKIRVNADKSEAVFFKKGKLWNPNDDLTLTFNGTKINFKASVKYLGYRLQSNLKHNEHVNHNIVKATIALRTLHPVMRVNNGISSKVKAKVYTSIIRPSLIYGIPAWHNAPKYLLNKIQVFENRCLRQSIDFRRTPTNPRYISNDALHTMTKVPMINQFMHKISLKFLQNTKWSENQIIKNLGNLTPSDMMNMIHKPPHVLLCEEFRSKLLSLS